MGTPAPVEVTGGTRVAGVIGWPVRHSLSPAIHNAAFAATGLDWTFLALPVAPGEVPAALDGMRALGIDGLSVTMPHKTAVAATLDNLTAAATALRAVNCVFRDGDHIVGDNTDGAGFVDSLRTDAGIDPSGMRCVVVGAGGAARAVIRALADAGAGHITVVNRDRSRAEAAAGLAGGRGEVGDAAALGTADLAVNATPLGMAGAAGGGRPDVPFDAGTLPAGGVVVDLVYRPATTPLLAAAADAGLHAVSGLGMLVHQAARAFTRWTGAEPPVRAMRDAALAGLG